MCVCIYEHFVRGPVETRSPWSWNYGYPCITCQGVDNQALVPWKCNKCFQSLCCIQLLNNLTKRSNRSLEISVVSSYNSDRWVGLSKEIPDTFRSFHWTKDQSLSSSLLHIDPNSESWDVSISLLASVDTRKMKRDLEVQAGVHKNGDNTTHLPWRRE